MGSVNSGPDLAAAIENYLKVHNGNSSPSYGPRPQTRSSPRSDRRGRGAPEHVVNHCAADFYQRGGRGAVRLSPRRRIGSAVTPRLNPADTPQPDPTRAHGRCGGDCRRRSSELKEPHLA